MSNKMTVAVIGTGIMGLPVARNLARAGFSVRAWNRTMERALPLREWGIQVHSTAVEAAGTADIIVTLLADADAVVSVMEEVVTAGGLSSGCTWAQMGTIGIEGTDRCAKLAAGAGLDFVDAPVLGTKGPAEAGQLSILASGTDEAIDRCARVFEAIGSKTLRLGDAGAGTLLKLVTNAWVVTLVEGVAEAIALAEALGVDPRDFLDLIAGGPLDAGYAQAKGAAMIAGEFPTSFPLRLARKDAALAAHAAETLGLNTPMYALIAGQMQEAVDRGYGDLDMAATIHASKARQT